MGENESQPVLIDFEDQDAEDAAGPSKQALEAAMHTLSSLSAQVTATLKAMTLEDRPARTEMRFGLTFNEAGEARIAQELEESALQFSLVWERDLRGKPADRPLVGLVPRKAPSILPPAEPAPEPEETPDGDADDDEE